MILSVVSVKAQDATELYNLAKQHVVQNEFDEAITKFQQASSLFKADGLTQNWIITEVGLIELYINLGKIDEALPRLTEIEPEAIAIYGEQSKIVAYIYTLQGRIFFMTSNLNDALVKFQKALRINTLLFGPESIETAKTMNDLALVYANSGKVDSAIYYYNKNVEIVKNIEGENSSLLPQAYINLANLYITLGNYDEAIEINLRIIEIVSTYKGEVCEEVGEAYSSLGNVYLVKAEYYIAEEYFKKSVEIFKQIYGNNSYRIATNYINLGNLYNKIGNYDFALQYYFLSTKILEDNFAQNANFPGLYNNIGLVCKNQQNFDNAEIYFQKALDAKTVLSGANDAETAIILTNLGTVLKFKGDLDAAQKSYLKSVRMIENIQGVHNPYSINPLLNIANLYFEEGDIDSANIYFYKSINANQRSQDVEVGSNNIPLNSYYDGIQLLEAINSTARIELYGFNSDSNTVHLENALQKILICDDLITKLRSSYFNKEDKIRLNAQISKVFDNAVEVSYLMLFNNVGDRNEIIENIFYFVERNKTSSLLQAITDAKVQNFSNVPDSLLQIEREIKDRINMNNLKLADAVDDDEKNYYRSQILKENQNYTNIINFYKTNYPDYYSAKFNVSTTKISDIQGFIDNETALIDYYLTEEHIFSIIITKNDVNVISLPLQGNLSGVITLMNKSLLTNEDDDLRNYIASANKLYDKIFSFNLASNINNLIIIPDDILGTVSFEALFTHEYTGDLNTYTDYPYLIKKYQISYSYSASLFYEILNTTSDNVASKNILSLAPVFSPGNSQTFKGVPVNTIRGSETEVINIGQLFTDNNLSSVELINNNANETQFKQLISSNKYNIIHIATHGYVDFQNPELSALILAKNQNIDDNDGILYSGEIYNLDLNCDLITLSACETARGVISKGEGVIGLSRAFMYAGAKNLIISLWKVSDLATSELMYFFYSELLTLNPNLSNNTEFSLALHNAKLEMIQSGYGHPYFWSSFILIGR